MLNNYIYIYIYIYIYTVRFDTVPPIIYLYYGWNRIEPYGSQDKFQMEVIILITLSPWSGDFRVSSARGYHYLVVWQRQLHHFLIIFSWDVPVTARFKI